MYGENIGETIKREKEINFNDDNSFILLNNASLCLS